MYCKKHIAKHAPAFHAGRGIREGSDCAATGRVDRARGPVCVDIWLASGLCGHNINVYCSLRRRLAKQSWRAHGCAVAPSSCLPSGLRPGYSPWAAWARPTGARAICLGVIYASRRRSPGTLHLPATPGPTDTYPAANAALLRPARRLVCSNYQRTLDSIATNLADNYDTNNPALLAAVSADVAAKLNLPVRGSDASSDVALCSRSWRWEWFVMFFQFAILVSGLVVSMMPARLARARYPLANMLSIAAVLVMVRAHVQSWRPMQPAGWHCGRERTPHAPVCSSSACSLGTNNLLSPGCHHRWL